MSCDARATRRRTKFPGSAAFYASRRPVEQFEPHFYLSNVFAEPRKCRSAGFPKPEKSLSKMRRWRTFPHLDRVFAPSFASNDTLRRPVARKSFLTRIHELRSPATVVKDRAQAPSRKDPVRCGWAGPTPLDRVDRMGKQCYHSIRVCTNSVPHPQMYVSTSVLLAHSECPPIAKNTNKGADLKTTRIKISNQHLTLFHRITNRQRRHKRAGNSLRHLQEGVRSRKFRQRRDFARRKALW